MPKNNLYDRNAHLDETTVQYLKKRYVPLLTRRLLSAGYLLEAVRTAKQTESVYFYIKKPGHTRTICLTVRNHEPNHLVNIVFYYYNYSSLDELTSTLLTYLDTKADFDHDAPNVYVYGNVTLGAKREVRVQSVAYPVRFIQRVVPMTEIDDTLEDTDEPMLQMLQNQPKRQPTAITSPLYNDEMLTGVVSVYVDSLPDKCFRSIHTMRQYLQDTLYMVTGSEWQFTPDTTKMVFTNVSDTSLQYLLTATINKQGSHLDRDQRNTYADLKLTEVI